MQIEIIIDDQALEVPQGSMIIEAADQAGIRIPRFCYHKKLSVAANCRMCLVEVEKIGKPLPACATPVTQGMRIYTQSQKARDAQQAVMEFLLINHPLDCPICDQGGECELQDNTMQYGRDISRYTEKKRVIEDKDIGPLIATDMTRCIHCTRCVRFGTEIAGMKELGVLNRGEKLAISTYIEKQVASELSGNVIDLCPVGALTSKPFRFQARAWEMVQYASIAPHDCVGSNIYIHVRKPQVMRVVPREREEINETWISDRDRFSYLGVQSEDRLLQPMIKSETGQWQEVNWSSALKKVTHILHQQIKKSGPDSIGACITPQATLEELYLFQKLFRSLNILNIDHRLKQVDFSDQNCFSLYPGLNGLLTEIEAADTLLLIGSNIYQEQPLMGHRIRKATIERGAQVFCFNSIEYTYHFACTSLGIASANNFAVELENLYQAIENPDNPAHASAPLYNQFKEALYKSQKTYILLGAFVEQHPQAGIIRYIAQKIAKIAKGKVGILTEGPNTAGAWIAGAIPHRSAIGMPLPQEGLTITQMWDAYLKTYVLFQIEPDQDCINAHVAIQALKNAESVIAFTSFKNALLSEYAQVLLPIGTFTEINGTYINIEGRWQRFKAATIPPGAARSGWKVLQALMHMLQIPGSSYTSSLQIYQEIKDLFEQKSTYSYPQYTYKAPIKTLRPEGALERISEWPLYRIDSIVRRSMPLQKTALNKALGVYLHPKMAKNFQWKEPMQFAVSQNGSPELILSAFLSEAIPIDCVWIPAGYTETTVLGDHLGFVQLREVL